MGELTCKKTDIAQFITDKMSSVAILNKTATAYRSMIDYEYKHPGTMDAGMKAPVEFVIDNPAYPDSRIGETNIALALDNIAENNTRNIAMLYDSSQWTIQEAGKKIIISNDISLPDAHRHLEANNRMKGLNRDTKLVFEPEKDKHVREYTDDDLRKEVALMLVEQVMDPDTIISNYRDAYKDLLGEAAYSVGDEGTVQSNELSIPIAINVDTYGTNITKADVTDAINTLRRQRNYTHDDAYVIYPSNDPIMYHSNELPYSIDDNIIHIRPEVTLNYAHFVAQVEGFDEEVQEEAGIKLYMSGSKANVFEIDATDRTLDLDLSVLELPEEKDQGMQQ